MAIKTAQLVLTRNEFYYNSYRLVAKLAVLLALITILLIGIAIFQAHNLEPWPKYFPTTPDGKLIAMPPVDINHLELSEQEVNPKTGIIVGMPEPTIPYAQLEPEGEDALIKYWADLAVNDMFDYDYIHYRAEIQDSSKYFTAIGHDRFIDALISSKNLETVKVRSAVVIPEVTGAIKITGTGMVQGHFFWDVVVPLKLTYESAASETPIVQTLQANLSIARVSTLLSPFYGLAIFRLNFEQIFNTEE